MINRSISTDLYRLMGKFPAIAILGPRQVGKTTLAKQLSKKIKSKTIYLDLENPIDRAKLSDAYSFFYTYQNYCVILDEIQVMPELFSVLRSAIDSNRKNGRFILLGSASPELVKGAAESLAGRIHYNELSPINLKEISRETLVKRHWFRGGFPKALLPASNKDFTDWMDSFIKSYIERDLNALFGVSFSVSTMRNFWSMLAHTQGSILNTENYARSLGVSAPTINRYIDFLEGAYIISRLPAYFVNTKKRLVKSPKIYIRDTGILHRLHLIGKAEDLNRHIVVGASWESYVIEQIKLNLGVGLQSFYYRTHSGAECDLVLVKGHLPIACIEIKLSNVPSLKRGFFESAIDLKVKKLFVITPDSEDYLLRTGVRVCSLIDFLEKYLRKIK